MNTASTRRASAAALALATAITAQAAAIDSSAVQRELSVLQGILQTALGNDHPGIMRAAVLSGHYLAHQGMVVRIRPRNLARAVRMTSSSRNGGDAVGWGEGWAEGWQEIPRLVQDVLVDVQLAMAPVNMDSVQRLGEIRAEQRELRNRQRDLRRQLLGLRRELQRLPEGGSSEDLMARIERAEQELAVLDEAHERLETEFADEVARLEERGSERREGVRQDIEAELEGLQASLIRTLCDYGASLRSVADDEYITVILEGVVNRPGDNRHDRLIVSRKSDLSACQSGSISVEALAQRVTVYEG